LQLDSTTAIKHGVRVYFYRTAAGASPVQKYLDGLPMVEGAKITAALEDIEKNGLVGSAVRVRPIEGELWELKIDRHRIFYVLLRGPELVLLHAYWKQSQKAPRNEIEIARRRMKEILANDPMGIV
jgi:phage-related protein